jgi:entericidin B
LHPTKIADAPSCGTIVSGAHCPDGDDASCSSGKELIMVRKILTVGLIAGTFAISACNTVAGAGKDVSSVGHATTKAADSNK